MKPQIENINPTLHSSSIANGIFKIYIKTTLSRSSSQLRTPSNNANSLNSLMSLSKNNIIRLKKQIDRTIEMKENRVKELQREEVGLRDRMKKIREWKRIKAKNINQEDNSKTMDFQSKRWGLPSPLANAHQLLPKTATQTQHPNKSLYQREKQEHLDNIRKSNSYMKVNLAQQKVISLYQKQAKCQKIQTQKQRSKENRQKYQELMKIMQEKKKEQDFLEYQQMGMKSLLKRTEIEEEEKEWENRVQKLRDKKKRMEDKYGYEA